MENKGGSGAGGSSKVMIRPTAPPFGKRGLRPKVLITLPKVLITLPKVLHICQH
jgi:hypothetical protein